MAEDALDRAVRRLDAALSALESRWAERGAETEPDLFAARPDPAAQERVVALESERDALRTRERALEQVAAEASAALGRAAAEVRAALAAES